MAEFDAELRQALNAVRAKLSEESTSYGALQYLQSFVARKRKANKLNSNNISEVVFHGAECMIANGSAKDAGHALQWFVQSKDLFHLDPQVTSSNSSSGEAYCDSLRMLELFEKFSSNSNMHECASVIYDPFHGAVVDSKLTSGHNLNSNISKRMKEFDEKCASIFENARVWHSAYRVSVRLNLIENAASILNKWSTAEDSYMDEKPLFFCRSILKLLSEKKVLQAVQMVNASKTILRPTDNAREPATPGRQGSAQLACWHLSIILAELAQLPPAQRVDKKKLFTILTGLYADMMDSIDGKLTELLEKIGLEVFDMGGPKKKQADPMSMLQAMMSAGGLSGQSKTGGMPGNLGGMDPSVLMSMMNNMQAEKRPSQPLNSRTIEEVENQSTKSKKKGKGKKK